MKVLLTGATGFLGGALLRRLVQEGHVVTAVARRPVILPEADELLVSDLGGNHSLLEQLTGHGVVIHAAARAHVMKDESVEPLAEYRRVNVEGTMRLAEQAALAGVKRFIYISSIKVNGESTHSDSCFKASDQPAPEDAYGASKYEAEKTLMGLAMATGMEVVIIRPPLVYGPGVKGNLASLFGMLRRGVPLPLGAIHNRRSLIGIDNLVDLIMRCMAHPAAANRVFLASDGDDVSTTRLLKTAAFSMGLVPRLIPVPERLLWWGASLLQKKAMARRLLGSLQVDISDTCRLLDWVPPYTFEQGLQRMMQGATR